MRNTEQRTAAVRARVSELEYDSRWRRNLGISIASVAACLLLILGLSFAMPGLSTQISAVSAADKGAAASMFSGSGAMGYIVIGVVAFILGAVVTLLCIRLRSRNRDKDETT